MPRQAQAMSVSWLLPSLDAEAGRTTNGAPSAPYVQANSAWRTNNSGFRQCETPLPLRGQSCGFSVDLVRRQEHRLLERGEEVPVELEVLHDLLLVPGIRPDQHLRVAAGPHGDGDAQLVPGELRCSHHAQVEVRLVQHEVEVLQRRDHGTERLYLVGRVESPLLVASHLHGALARLRDL